MAFRPKKIALVYDAIFPFIKGGAEKRFYEIGKRLSQEGHDVHLYGMKSWEGADVIEYEGMTLHGICNNHPLYTKSGRRSIYQAVMFGIASFRLWREPFDVIDCCGFPYFSLFPLRLITWLRRKKLYSTWHEVWGMEYWKKYLGFAGIFGYFIERVAVLLPNTIISVSGSTTESIARKLGRKSNVVTIPNGLDVDRIKNIKPASVSSDIIYVGRLLSYKNVDVLIRATHLLTKDHPNILLAIIGDGPERENLEKLVEQLQIQKNVRFVGFVEKDNDVYAHMHASKVLVLPSTREGFGIVVLEANACGLPVITINHMNNAAKDLITESVNGVVCALDKLSLTQKIALELEERKEPVRYQSFAGAYDWKAILPLIDKTYFPL
jgi:glycosyltransferase involved in cell wall biosynthesis